MTATADTVIRRNGAEFMPALSKKQRRMMAIAEHFPTKLYARNRGVLSMSKRQLSEFAGTPEKGLPASKRLAGRLKKRKRTRKLIA